MALVKNLKKIHSLDYIIPLTAITILAAAFVYDLYRGSNLFSRTGSLVVFLALTLEFSVLNRMRKISNRSGILIAGQIGAVIRAFAPRENWSAKEQAAQAQYEELKQKFNIEANYESYYRAIGYLAFAMAVMGTVVWGFGDIPFCFIDGKTLGQCIAR